MTNGFLRIASVAPQHRVADVAYNVDRIIESLVELDSKKVELAVYPELCITGYTCGDLFHNATLLNAAAAGLQHIREAVSELNIHAIVGLPVRKAGGAVYNCAAFIRNNECDIIEKTYLPSYNEFYERRWFSPSATPRTPRFFTSHGVKIGIEICEDLWVPVPPSCNDAMAGAQVICNLSASDDLIGKHDYLMSLIRQQSARCMCGYVYSSAGFGESTTDLVFLPKTIIAECGTLLCENDRLDYLSAPAVIADIDIDAIDRDREHTTTFADCARNNGCLSGDTPVCAEEEMWDEDFEPDYRRVNPTPFIPSDNRILDDRAREISTIQQCGLARRLRAVGSNRLVVGISGGLDSTLALLVAVETVKSLGGDAKDVIGVTMPGFGTTDRTYDNALQLMRLLGVTVREISIAAAVTGHFKDIGHDPSVHDVTYENSQARERTQILMDVANATGSLVLGTGDLSELALGWATYNGDHMSMYGVNAGVPKTLVRYLVRWYATKSDDAALRATLEDIMATPISPELTPADNNGNIQQKTEELVGPYELHDFFLYYMLRYGFAPRKVFMLARKAFAGRFGAPTILHWMREFYRRFFNQQFKRSCLPDGPKVGSVCLSPRGDWRMPSDASSAVWLNEIDGMIARLV
ncbi:MAG: NAD(+) synthase [Paramuribaculum sp.]